MPQFKKIETAKLFTKSGCTILQIHQQFVRNPVTFYPS